MMTIHKKTTGYSPVMTNIESIDGKSSMFLPRKCKSIPSGPFLELEHLSLLLLLASQLEVLASFDGNLILSLAVGALQPEDDLLGGLGLLSEDGLGLSTVSLLLAVVTTLALGLQRVLTLLVLRHLVKRVLPAFGGGTESAASLGNVNHFQKFVFIKP